MTAGSRSVLAEAIAGMPAFNTHDHAWQSFSLQHTQQFDLPYMLGTGYLGGDVAAAGFRQPPGLFDYLQDPALPDGAEKAWQALQPFLPAVRATSYFRAMLRSLHELFGLRESDIFSGSWKDTSDRVRRYSRESKGQGARLCARMNVTATVLDSKLDLANLAWVQPGDHRALHVVRLDMFIHEERGLAAMLAGHPGRDFDGWLAAFDAAFRRGLDAGAVGFKSGLAYNRRIEYGDPTYDQAARIFQSGVLQATAAEKTDYQDFMMNRLCRLCTEAAVPLQIHSGLQTGNGGVLENTRPTLLTSLFRRHGDLRVDLFHGGYPWYIQAGLMAKYFPNVYIDGCWLPQISPSVYRAALTSWIETVPGNKILAWGGDSSLLEKSFGALLLARDLISETLAGLVDNGYVDVETALRLAQAILHDNAAAFWRLA